MKLEICILAGGLGTRLGRDKARLRFGRRTMLSIICGTASRLPYPVRVIRRDRVARCGPLGGVFTALESTRADAVLFLACDMPFVTVPLLERIIRSRGRRIVPVFAQQSGRPGFPFLLPVTAHADVQSQIAQREFSLHALAERLGARMARVPADSSVLFNVNTAEEAAQARRLLDRNPNPPLSGAARRQKD